MSHYAQVKNGQVQQVIVAEADFVATLPDAEDWIQTSYNTYKNQHRLGGTALRGNYAAPGFVYDSANDVFYPPKPFPSWTLDTATWSWQAPVPRPADGGMWDWDETTGTWVPTQPLGHEHGS